MKKLNRMAVCQSLAVVFLAVLFFGGLSGCAPQLNRIELSVQDNRDEINKLEAENKKLMQEVQALGALLRMDRNAGDESSAMRLAKLSQVSTQLDRLLQKLDDNAEYMRDLSARVDLLAQRQGIPTLGEYKPPASGSADMESLPEEGRSIFEAAELDRNRGNLELAREGFEEFLKLYGDSELGDDALYWLGDLAYGEGDYVRALTRFTELMERFPESERMPAALYTARSCLVAEGRLAEAEKAGEELVRRYPDSSEAALFLAESEDN